MVRATLLYGRSVPYRAPDGSFKRLRTGKTEEIPDDVARHYAHKLRIEEAVEAPPKAAKTESWPLKQPPEDYLKRWPKGQWANLARSLK